MTKAQANKANAQRSTGPKSAAGKARSSRNSVSHGFQCGDVVLAHENAAEFDHILHHYQQQVDLTNPEQAFLAGQIANAQWRVLRAQRLTRLYLDLEITGPSAEPSPDETIVRNMEERSNDVPATLHRHETHFQRLWWRIHRKFEALRELAAAPWEFDFEEQIRREELECAAIRARSEARYQAEQQQIAAAADAPAASEEAGEEEKDLVADFTPERCQMILDAAERIENGQTNPTAEETRAEALLVLLGPAERARYCEAAKAKIAQTKPMVMAA